jgi:hypothetical protein
MMHGVEMASRGMLYVASLMMIDTGFQPMLSFTSETLESVMLVLLMGKIYVLRRWHWLRCHYVRTNFNEDWLRLSK